MWTTGGRCGSLVGGRREDSEDVWRHGGGHDGFNCLSVSSVWMGICFNTWDFMVELLV
jgi:hypothetical protein